MLCCRPLLLWQSHCLTSRILYKFFVPAQIHYWNNLLCSFKRLSALHEVTDVFMWTYEYSITYLALCWQCVHHHQGDAKEFLGPGRREVLTSVFSSKSLILSLAEVSLAFLILISYSFIHFQINTFVCVANNHQLNNCTLIFLFLFCMALAHVLYSSSSNSFLSKDEPRSPNNVAPN